MTTLEIILAALGGGGLTGIGTSLIVGLLQRPKVRADAVALLTDAALKQVDELQERTAEAERGARAARDDLAAALGEIRKMRSEIDSVVTTLRRWRGAILLPTNDPASRLEQLREMVTTDSTGINGTHL